LVDDAPEIARVVQHLARRAGLDLICRTDVPSGWEYLQTEDTPRPDLVLLDVNLPGASGIDLFRRMRSEGGELASLPVALFVTWSAPGLIAEGLEAGVDFVVAKDLLARPDDWKERIAEVMDLAAHPPALASGAEDVELAGVSPLPAVQQALRHPSLRRLGDEVVRALWARTLRRALAGDEPFPELADVDVWGPAAKLTQTLAPLTACRPTFLVDLVNCLSYQTECLLGKAASEPLRMPLAAALARLAGPA
jgi:CheY-like chemotaxis protein